MRLTLRTLLAYLDDTLDASEARLIGEKVAESRVATELVERLRKVSRRRGLAAPAGGDDKLDPNTAAEYLDNVLPGDQLAAVEETCLSSDVHLAEIAACHQILALVVGQPAAVPTTAYERMVGLVKGREAGPYRKPPPPPPEDDPDADAAAAGDDEFLGLPIVDGTRGGLGRRLLAWGGPPAAAAALALVVWYVLRDAAGRPPAAPPDRQVAAVAPKPEPVPEIKPVSPPKTPDPAPKPPEPAPKPPEPDAKPAPKPEPPKVPLDQPAAVKPAEGRREFAKYASKDRLLLAGPGTWKPVAANARVSTSDVLVSPPGFRNELVTDSGVKVLLWGSLPELLDLPFELALTLPLYESSATFHVPPAGFDLDLTLHRGRVRVTAPADKATTKVKVRFAGEAWDVTLTGGGAEVLVDRINRLTHESPFSPDKPESPQVEVTLGVLRGEASAAIGFRGPVAMKAAPGKAMLLWDNKGTGIPDLEELPGPLPPWSDKPPSASPSKEYAANMEKVLSELARSAAKSGKLDVALAELRQAGLDDLRRGGTPSRLILSVHCLSATDRADELIDALDDIRNPPVIRIVAQKVLVHWVAQGTDHDAKLYAMLQGPKGYSKREADGFMAMLHGFTESQGRDPELYEKLLDALGSNRLGVRELAFGQMVRFDPDGPAKTGYRPDADASQRDYTLGQWRKRIPDGKVPPAPAPPPPPRK